MIDFDVARKVALDTLKTEYTVSVLDDVSRTRSYPNFIETWEVSTHVLDAEQGKLPITFHICFGLSFPLLHPSIFLVPTDYDKIKFIPHLDTDRMICTFDSETTRTIPELPDEIVKYTLEKAIKIVQDGIAGNNQEDFKQEFHAYWGRKYGNSKHEIDTSVLSLIETNPHTDSVSILQLNEPLNGYNFVLCQDNSVTGRFKQFLNKFKLHYSENFVFYVDELDKINVPPFNYSNRDTLKLIEEYKPELNLDFKKYINNSKAPKCLLFKKTLNNKPSYLGWIYENVNATRKGFKSENSSRYINLTTTYANIQVRRMAPDVYVRERVLKRTQGNANNTSGYKFLIAGVGSVGSNLIYFLNSLNAPEFRLVDNDFLKLENIERHLLGFSDLGGGKAAKMAEKLLLDNPTQQVSSIGKSIIEVCLKEPSYINDVDYIFAAIGKTNIDNWLGEAVNSGVINKPMFLLWVEPYLAGGHCIYLHPDGDSYSSFYNNTGLFKYNIIHEEEYLNGNELLTLNEAGCQTSYTPYSGNNVVKFLSRLFPEICKIIEEKPLHSMSFTWVGNTKTLSDLGIKMTTLPSQYKPGVLITNL